MDTIGSEELEMEYVASKLISGIILPSNYIDIRAFLSKMPIVDSTDEITLLLETLKESVISNLDLLKDSEVSKYYDGNNEDVKDLLNSINNRAEILIPLYDQAIDEKLELEIQRLEHNIAGQDYVGIGQAIDTTSFENAEIQRINDTKIQLITLKGLTESLLQLYGTAVSKLPSKSIPATLNTKYKLFLLDLSNNIDKVSSNVILSSVMGRIIGSLGSIIPQNDLDPFKSEIVNNLLSSLVSPKDYYKDCKTGQIVSSEVGDLFCSCYPEFGDRFVSMYLDDYETMTFQEQINFRKCFALPADDSQLLQLTNTYIKMSYT